MTIQIKVSTQTPKEGESIQVSGAAVPLQDIDVVVQDTSGRTIAVYIILLKTAKIPYITFVPSRLGKVLTLYSVGEETSEAGNDITITVQAAVAPPAPAPAPAPTPEPTPAPAPAPAPAPVPQATYVLRITATAGGHTDLALGSSTWLRDAVVTITAIPDQGYELVRWEINGVAQPAAPTVTVTMVSDITVNAVFERSAAPPPAPAVDTGSVTVKAQYLDSRQNAVGARVTLDSQTLVLDANGSGEFTGLKEGSYTVVVEAASYKTYSTTLFLKAGQTYPVDVALERITFLDPWGALVSVLEKIWDLGLAVFSTFSKKLGALVAGQALGILDQTREATSKGSPDEEKAKVALEIARNLRRRQEEIVRDLYKHSPALEESPGTAGVITALLLGTQVTVEAAAIILDLTHPIKPVGMRKLAERVMNSLGTGGLVSDIVTMPSRAGLLPQLNYWYNSQFTPLIPNIQDLITMLVREVITPTQYVELAAMHGESKTWADRRWETHWRLPGPDMITEAYHRGLVGAAERDAYMVLHDYKPEPRTGIQRSDLRIIAGLQKQLIPRVDLRRAWRLGIIDDAELVKRYGWLGYEDDAPLMAEIQKDAGLEADRSAVARAAGRGYRDKKISETTFREYLATMKIVGERADLWVLRFKLERLAKVTPEEALAEEVAASAATAEEEAGAV